MEPSSLAAVGDRSLLYLNSPFSTACPGDLQAPPKSSNVPLEEPERLARDATPKKKEVETVEFEK